MKKLWVALCVFNAIMSVVFGIKIAVTGEGLSLFSQVIDQSLLAILFTGLAVHEYGKGRN